tara:strand:+ start:49 stop:546 length:498 start_codon:yes stop_codon:yes gene_type:complete
MEDVYVQGGISMSKMGWESAKRDMELLSRFKEYIELSTNPHSSSYILQYSCKYMETDRIDQKNKPAFAKNETRKVHQVDFHRNGISGQGFYSVRYDWADYDGVERRMLATIEAPPEHLSWDETTCRVIDIDEPELGWRGDSLASRIISMVVRHNIETAQKNRRTK